MAEATMAKDPAIEQAKLACWTAFCVSVNFFGKQASKDLSLNHEGRDLRVIEMKADGVCLCKTPEGEALTITPTPEQIEKLFALCCNLDEGLLRSETAAFVTAHFKDGGGDSSSL